MESDAQLVECGRRGDRAALAILVSRHLKRIVVICLTLLGNAVEAEDAAQETFVKGLTRLDALRDPDRFGAWLGQIARNHCRDALRARDRERTVALTDVVAEGLPASPSSDGSDRKAEAYADLRTALDRLPADLRQPLVQFYYEGKDTRKLAEALNLTQGGACARLYRARRALRRILAETGGDHV